MALQVSLTSLQQASCSEWVFTDNTGAYDAATNLTGWTTATSGGSNLRVDNSSITVATLAIARYSGGAFLTPTTIDLMSQAIWTELTGDTGAPFSSTTTLATLVYIVTTDFIGAITDGVYQVTYTVSNGTTTSTVTYQIATYCNIECCLEQRLANVPNEYSCVACDNSYLDVTMTLWTLLQALKLAACNASIDKYIAILTTLQTACEQAGCNCS